MVRPANLDNVRENVSKSYSPGRLNREAKLRGRPNR